MSNETILNLDPSEILIRANVRYGLKPYRVDSLAEDILLTGRVHTPVTVEELEEPEDGKSYALVFGNYRHAAVNKLNTKDGAGLTLPCRIIPALSPADRVKLQVSENTDRENMSPMDKAIAIQQMMDNGISKMDIRNAFAAPGGRKGIKMQPASNSHINMLLSFLDFPKNIQKSIHDGIIGMGAAYELKKSPSEKWQGILDRIEAARQKEMDREEKEEDAYLSQNKKVEETSQKQEEAAKALEDAKKLAADAEALATAKAAEVAEALKKRISAKGDEKKQATEHFKATEAELKSAQTVADKAAKELAAIEGKAKTAAEKAEAAKARLEAARKAKGDKAATTKAPVTGKQVRKASQESEGKPVKLNQAEMRDAVKSLTLLSSPNKNPKTIAVGMLLTQCFDGIITDGQLQQGIARLVGEEKMPTSPRK